MGKLVVTEFVSLDGVAEDPGGAESHPHGGWAFKFDRGDVGNRFKGEELWAADAQLLGRVTYEAFAKAWPNMNSDDFGRKFNSMPKHVVSSSPLGPEWTNSTRVEGELGPAVQALKERYSGDLLVSGSLSLARALAELDLVDEYRLLIYPVVLGAGKRLFAPDGPSRPLRLLSHEQAGECLAVTFATSASS